jgi:NADPH:quinone reductase-like Zn-dependent oxidoreductase
MSNHTITAVLPVPATTSESSQKRVMKAWHISRFGLDALTQVQALARNGEIALIGLMDGWTLTADIVPLLFSRGAIRGVLVGSRRNFEDLNRALDRVRLRPVIDRVYQFSNVPAAFEHLSRGAFGKIVVEIGAGAVA